MNSVGFILYWPALSPPPLSSWRWPLCAPARSFAKNRWQLTLDTPEWRCKPSGLWTPTGCSFEVGTTKAVNVTRRGNRKSAACVDDLGHVPSHNWRWCNQSPRRWDRLVSGWPWCRWLRGRAERRVHGKTNVNFTKWSYSKVFMFQSRLNTYREGYFCICFCSYFQASGPPPCSSSPLPPTFGEPVGDRHSVELQAAIPLWFYWCYKTQSIK